MKQFDTVLTSKRNTNIHATIIDSEATLCGLVIFVHGFKADRTEGGRFLTVGKALANLGINSICMSFAGCGDSEEPFDNYSLSSCIDDMDTCYQYMLDTYSIDTKRMGMIGYSMGGRLTCLYTKLHPEFHVIGLWAAASYNGFDEDGNFLGKSVEDMTQEANEHGFANVLNAFDGTYLHLTKEFFNDMQVAKPLDALNAYQGCVIICHGDKDITVPLHASLHAYESLTTQEKRLLVVKDADHGFGLWDDHMEQSQQLTDATIDFFTQYL